MSWLDSTVWLSSSRCYPRVTLCTWAGRSVGAGAPKSTCHPAGSLHFVIILYSFSSFFREWQQDIKSTKPIVQVFPKHMWLSCFLMSHWPNQVTWGSPDSVCKGTIWVHGNRAWFIRSYQRLGKMTALCWKMGETSDKCSLNLDLKGVRRSERKRINTKVLR